MSKNSKDENRYKLGLVPVYWVAGVIVFVILALWLFSGQG